MKRFYLMGFVAIIAASNAYAYDYQAGEKNWSKWIACTSDEECMPVYDACGGWTALNVQFKTEGVEYQNELANAVKCVPVKAEPPPKVLCLEQVCTVKPDLLEKAEK